MNMSPNSTFITQHSTLLARVAWAGAALFFAFALFFSWIGEPDNFISFAFLSLGFLAFPTVGALIVARQPGNSIGWIFCAVGLLIGFWLFAGQYAAYTLVIARGSLPGGLAVAWIGGPLGEIGWGLITTFLALLFPTGKLLSPHWRPLAWAAAFVIVLQMAGHVILPGPLSLTSFGDYIPPDLNPTGIEALAGASDLISNTVQSLFLVVAIPCLASIIVRYRRAQGIERAQIRWFAYAVVLVPTVFSLVSLRPFQSSTDVIRVPGDAWELITDALFGIAIAAFPAAVGIAILRYRLWDVDNLINRTLVYVALTAILATIYFGSVLLLEALLRPIIGQRNEPAIVISTLGIAALFNPLRVRIQQFIDRRFYRRKYDATRALANFSGTVRDEVDLGALSGRLVEIVDETMQPAHVSVWLRTPQPASTRKEE